MAEHIQSGYLVDRPELRRRLSAGLSLPLTLLVAQAGAGKTVLLQQWSAQHPDVQFVWIDVEPADDDPVRFWRRLVSALRAVSPDVLPIAGLPALGAGGRGAQLVEALSTELKSFPEIVVVLDDLHHLTNRILLADIGELVAAVPPNAHLVISTRVDPPIAWSRLRLRGRLLELRQADLAMTGEESEQLLVKITGRDVPPAHLEVLVGRTEGWAAGLQLAGLTLKRQEHPDKFIAGFGGSDRLIAEYLTEEVLDVLPDDERDVLLRLASLDTMSAELVDEVLERSDARQLFERLEHRSMFLVALDANRQRFRFHQLFRDLLRYRLRADAAAEETRLLGRAADHHLDRGQVAPAVEYLLRSRDWDRALHAIMKRGSEVFERGEMQTVIRWIRSIPEGFRRDRLDVVLELAILEGMQGDIAPAVDGLSRVANDQHATIGQRIVANAWNAATAQWNPHPGENVRSAERALALLDSYPRTPLPDLMHLTTPELLKTLALGSAGRAHFFAGDVDEAESCLMGALDSEGIGYPPFRVAFLGSLALLRVWCGRAGDADLLAAEAREAAARSGLLTHGVMADVQLAEAMIAYERGLPESATAPLRDGTFKAEANHRTQLEWISSAQQASLALAEGRFEDALELVDVPGHDARSAPSPAMLDRLLALRMRVLRRSGRCSESLRLLGGSAPTSGLVCFEAIAALLTLGDRTTADRLRTRTHDSFAVHGPRRDVEQMILTGWSAELSGSHVAALEVIGTALDRAEADGLVAVFIESDPIVLALIAELSVVRGGLASVILRRWRAIQSPSANAELPDPLTDRELEILAYFPVHSTSAELAKQFFVSVNTLKTHISHIYRKLDVTDRSAAIAKARDLGLLGSVSQVERAGA